MRASVPAIAILLMVLSGAACDKEASPTAPAQGNVTGTWTSTRDPKPDDERMTFVQDGSRVTGTYRRHASFGFAEAALTGTVTGTQFAFGGTITSTFSDGRVCTTQFGAEVTVSGDTMTGSSTSVPQPPCSARPAVLPATWVRVSR